jgi:hypothetical protein
LAVIIGDGVRVTHYSSTFKSNSRGKIIFFRIDPVRTILQLILSSDKNSRGGRKMADEKQNPKQQFGQQQQPQKQQHEQQEDRKQPGQSQQGGQNRENQKGQQGSSDRGSEDRNQGQSESDRSGNRKAS